MPVGDERYLVITLLQEPMKRLGVETSALTRISRVLVDAHERVHGGNNDKESSVLHVGLRLISAADNHWI